MTWTRLLLAVAGTAVLLPVAGWLIHPWPLPLRWLEPRTTAYMEHRAREAEGAGEPLEIRHAWVPLDRIAPDLRRAVLVAEDDRFYEHGGVDWDALAEEVGYGGTLPPSLRNAEDRAALREAFRTVREEGDRIRGRSTITQQLARNLYLSPDRTFLRKAQELVIARRLEGLLPKDRILEIYLNVAELGPGIFGAEAAARHYFGVSAGELSRFQAASLAATLPHPLTSNPEHRPGQMAWRRDLILRRLAGPPPAEPEPLPPALEPELPDTVPEGGRVP